MRVELVGVIGEVGLVALIEAAGALWRQVWVNSHWADGSKLRASGGLTT